MTDSLDDFDNFIYFDDAEYIKYKEEIRRENEENRAEELDQEIMRLHRHHQLMEHQKKESMKIIYGAMHIIFAGIIVVCIVGYL